jgi:hypothetical protein
VRAQAAKRGHAAPIIFERERIEPVDITLTIDQAALQKSCNATPPDPRLYKPLPGGGYAYIPALEQWEGDVVAIRKRARNARRRARRVAKKAARAAAAAAGNATP